MARGDLEAGDLDSRRLNGQNAYGVKAGYRRSLSALVVRQLTASKVNAVQAGWAVREAEDTENAMTGQGC